MVEVLDTTGLKCPLPVLRTRRHLENMKTGEKLRVVSSDPASVTDLPAFFRMAGHTLIIATKSGAGYIFEIEKDTGKIVENMKNLPHIKP